MAEEGKTAQSEGAQSSTSNMVSLGLRAVLIGATGAIGECILGELLSSKNFSSIVVLGRREAVAPSSYNVDQKAEQESGRLQQHIVDFEKISSETVGEHFKDKDIFFCTLGTTRKAAGSAEAFRHIDYDYVVNCAQVAKDCGIKSVSYVSTQGAKSNSWFLNTSVKGQVEEALNNMNFESTSFFKPGLLGRGDKARTLEKVAGWLITPIPVGTVARAMRIEAEQCFSKPQENKAQEQPKRFFNDDMKALITNA